MKAPTPDTIEFSIAALDDAERGVADEDAKPTRRLPAPLGVIELLGLPEPNEEWLAEGLVPASANVLIAGYPKTYKTMFLLELGVALATATPFLGRYRVPKPRRVGIVTMEDAPHRVRRRLSRLCLGRGLDLQDVDGRCYIWSRPPLRLTDETVDELARYAEELDLDFLGVDSWAYVAAGDSNSADEVTPQLQALSACRVRRPGLTVSLTHHARKDRGETTDDVRLTDIIRNSGAFGAWYDAGLVLARRDETSPVTIRAELRDYVAPDPFGFTVFDERPADPVAGRPTSGGWLRVLASAETPATLERRAAARKLEPAVREFLAEHPDGVSRTALREGLRGNHADIEAAFHGLVEAGEAEYTPPPGKGRPAVYRLVSTNPAQPCPDPAQAGFPHSLPNPAHPAPPPEGAGVGAGQGAVVDERGHPARAGSGGRGGAHECRECGVAVGATAELCARCRYGAQRTGGASS